MLKSNLPVSCTTPIFRIPGSTLLFLSQKLFKPCGLPFRLWVFLFILPIGHLGGDEDQWELQSYVKVDLCLYKCTFLWSPISCHFLCCHGKHRSESFCTETLSMCLQHCTIAFLFFISFFVKFCIILQHIHSCYTVVSFQLVRKKLLPLSFWKGFNLFLIKILGIKSRLTFRSKLNEKLRLLRGRY